MGTFNIAGKKSKKKRRDSRSPFKEILYSYFTVLLSGYDCQNFLEICKVTEDYCWERLIKIIDMIMRTLNTMYLILKKTDSIKFIKKKYLLSMIKS